MTEPKFLPDGAWRLPELPGVDQHEGPDVRNIPPGVTGYQLSAKQTRLLKRLLRSFDGAKSVGAMVKHAQTSEEWAAAMVAQLGVGGAGVDLGVQTIVEVVGLQRMWLGFANDRAAEMMEPGKPVSPYPFDETRS